MKQQLQQDCNGRSSELDKGQVSLVKGADVSRRDLTWNDYLELIQDINIL